MMRWLVLCMACGIVPAAAQAEFELSAYLGAQGATGSDVSGNDPGGVGRFSFGADWEGRPFEAPPHYGVRATWWRTATWGLALDLNHAKVYAGDEALAANGFDRLEMTDGLNLLTVNYMRRFPEAGRAWTPYLGVGLGVAVPYVEVVTEGGETFDYQLTGPAAAALAGVSYRVNDRWSVFGEGKLTWSSHDADLDNGGSLETEIVTHAVNAGVALRF